MGFFSFLTDKKTPSPSTPQHVTRKAEQPLIRQSSPARHPFQIDKTKVFNRLNEKEVIFLYNSAVIKKFPQGVSFIREGGSDKLFYIIIEGFVKIFRSINGNNVELATLTKGDCIGEIAFMTNARRLASAVTMQTTTLMAFDEKTLKSLPLIIRVKIDEYLLELIHMREYELTRKEVELSQKNNYLVKRYEKEKVAAASEYQESEMIENIIDSIPRLPLFVHDLLSRLRDKNVKVDDLLMSLNQDPSLVALTLKRVNSAYYSLSAQVDNLKHAVMLLGFSEVYKLVLDNAVKKTMPDKKEFNDLQSHSFVISIISQEISILCGLKNVMTTNTIGVLHDLGKSVILLLKEKYPKLHTVIDLLDHSKVGSILLKSWGLPEKVCTIIELQDFPKFFATSSVPDTIKKEVIVLYLAHLFEEILMENAELQPEQLDFTDFLTILKFPEKNPAVFFKKHLYPTLQRKKSTYPESFRNLLVQEELRVRFVKKVAEEVITEENLGKE